MAGKIAHHRANVYLAGVIMLLAGVLGLLLRGHLVDRGGEYAGDAGDEPGERCGVAGAAGRVEFSDRQRSHPLISGRRRERLGGLVDDRSRVAAVAGRHRERIRKLAEGRLYLLAEEPCLEGHNTWCVNVPGSLLVIPWPTSPST